MQLVELRWRGGVYRRWRTNPRLVRSSESADGAPGTLGARIGVVVWHRAEAPPGLAEYAGLVDVVRRVGAPRGLVGGVAAQVWIARRQARPLGVGARSAVVVRA